MKNILFCTGHKPKYQNIVRADNAKIYDNEGNKYLDLEAGVWCVSVGHSNKRITKVINEYSDKIIHTGYCYYNPIIEKAAENILDITGINDGKCVFLCSGSEANELGVKITKSIYNNKYIFSMKNSYFGAYGSVGDRDVKEWILYDWENDNNIDDIPFDKISGFIFEPGSHNGIVKFPPKNLIEKIVKNIKKNNGFVIANEVTTGIGRTGKWFGYNHYDIVPDMVVIGKGIGNGYPISCLAISKDVYDKIDLDKFHYAQSHQNDALGAAVANEVINIIRDENLINKSMEDGAYLRNRLNELKDKYGIIKEVRGRGLMNVIEYEIKDNISYAGTVNDKLLDKNIILVRRPGLEVFRIDPPLTILRSELDYFINTMKDILSNLY